VFSMMSDTDCGPTLAMIGDLLAAGHVKLPQMREFDLRDAAAAHRAIQTGHTRGKIVLRVADLDG